MFDDRREKPIDFSDEIRTIQAFGSAALNCPNFGKFGYRSPAIFPRGAENSYWFIELMLNA